MPDVTRAWDMLSKEKRNNAIQEIIGFFETERGETIGVIAAEEVLDFFLKEIARDIYNKGVTDAKEVLHRRFEDVSVDLDLLIQK